MRKFLISAALLSAFVAAAPAAAQRDYGRYDRGYGDYRGQNYERQLANLDERIERLFERRLVSAREAQRLQRRLDETRRIYFDARRGGISPREHQLLQHRIESLRSQIRDERQEGREDRRWDRDDRRYDRW